MKDLKLTITINKPAKDVFAFTLNPKNTPKWIDFVVIEETDEWPPKLGTTYRNRRHNDTEWSKLEVTEYVPDAHFTLSRRDGSYHVRYTCTPLTTDTTELAYYEWTDRDELAVPFTMESLQKLKHLMEGAGDDGVNNQDQQTQIALARKLLKTVRHAAYATVNENGTPHNSPLMLIYNTDLSKLYIGTYSESLHTKNLLRTGNAFVVLYDSFVKNQGGVYITGSNAHECGGDELVEALRMHNAFRAKYGSRLIDISYYQTPKPSQRMYSIDVAKIELYTVVRGEDGLIRREARVAIKPEVLVEGL